MNLRGEPERWTDDASDAPLALQKLLRNARDDVPGPRALRALGVAVPGFISQGSGAAAALAKAKATGSAAGAVKAGAAVKAGGFAASAKLATVVVVGAIATGSYYFARANDTATPAPTAGAVEPPQVSHVETTPTEPTTERATPPEETSLEPAAVEPPASAKVPQGPAKAPLEELPSLQRARSLLRSEPSKALALVRRHEQEFPRSQYTQEREVIRIEALRALGRHDEADRSAEDFNRRFPGSAHKSRLNRESQ